MFTLIPTNLLRSSFQMGLVLMLDQQMFDLVIIDL